MRAVPLLLLFWCAAIGEEPSPEIRYATKVKKFAKPGSAGKLSISLTLWHAGEKLGTGRISIEPTKYDGKGPTEFWELKEVAKMGDKTSGRRFFATSVVDRRLAARKGVVGEGTLNSILWFRRGDKIELMANRERRAVDIIDDVGVGGVAHAILFARLALGEKGRFKTGCLNAGDPKNYIGTIEWTFVENGTWCGKQARLVECKINDKRVTLAFHPKTRTFFGYKQVEAKGTVWALPKGFDPPK